MAVKSIEVLLVVIPSVMTVLYSIRIDHRNDSKDENLKKNFHILSKQGLN